MKTIKPILCVLLMLASLKSFSQYVSIPDVNFGTYLSNNYPSCVTGDAVNGWQLDISCPDVTSATIMDVSYQNIYNMDGVQYFTSLRQLTCDGNLLYNFSTYPPNLEFLSLQSCALTFLSGGYPQTLTTLQVDDNPYLQDNITTLPFFLLNYSCSNIGATQLPDPLPQTLVTLRCNNNLLSDLPALPASLYSLDCSSNMIDSLFNLPDLNYLYCSLNQLSSLPVLPQSLETLDCGNNPMTGGLPALPANLMALYCSSDQLTALPALPGQLQILDCGHNHQLTLPTLPAGLYHLYCSADSLLTMPAIPASLSAIDAHFNLLTTLPTLGPNIVTADFSYNRITTINPLPATIGGLNLSNNLLTSLPALPTSMASLNVSHNALSTLPALAANMQYLYADSNHLTSLPAIPASLIVLTLPANPQLHCLPRITQQSFTSFDIRGTGISCLPNRFSAINYFGINPATMPLCDPGSGCDFFYNISGTVHLDTAATCRLDSLHPGTPVTNMKVRLKQNGTVIQQFYTFTSGAYSFKAPSLGTYTVDIDTTELPLAVVCPASGIRSVALTLADSVKKYENFGLQCNGVDFAVRSIYQSRFRPRFNTAVSVDAFTIALQEYSVLCGAGTPGTVTISYANNSVSYVGPAPGALTPSSVAGHVLTYTVSDLNSLHAGDLGLILHTDSTAVVGSSVCITATITPSVPDARLSNNTLTQCYTIVNSFDPNHKDVVPEVIPPAGGWLTYTIHFQNTGSDTAYLVVLRDTLSALVDATSFQYLASSHHAVVQLDRRAMAFTFPHIDLVDSATNPALSQGWIQYRVRVAPQPLGTQVPNTAYIYFDYNAAIHTNTAVTTVGTVATCADTTINISAAICRGDTSLFHGQHLTSGGTYDDTLTSIGGCDSIISLTLIVRGVLTYPVTADICVGSSYSFGGRMLTAAGTYRDTAQNVYG